VINRLDVRFRPFAIAAALLAIIFIAMARLPETLVAQMARNRALDTAQADWAYRLLVIAALAQAAYGGFVVLQVERVRGARASSAPIAAMPRAGLVRTVARNAAVMVLLTLAYALAAFFITGQRGGFWLFAVIAVAQMGWYLRQVGEIARYVGRQPEPAPEAELRTRWRREPDDYCPPLARGVFPAPGSGPGADGHS
jgi:hypothetical protein